MLSVFPAAKKVSFTERDSLKRERPRVANLASLACGHVQWWTTYRARKASVDVSVTLYATRRGIDAALAEGGNAPVTRVQANGARVRETAVPVGVNGAPAGETGATSTYRNLFIESTSIAISPTRPIPIATQLRIHRAIEAAFNALR